MHFADEAKRREPMHPSPLGAHGDGPRDGTLLAIGLAFALALAQALHLGGLIVSDADEGTYVYAGRLMAEGAVPYRDFLLAHPPALPALAALFWKMTPSLLAVRLEFLALISVLGLSTFALVRRLTQSATAGLAAMALQTLGMLFVANMGRTVRLEPLMAVLLMTSAWSLFRGRSRAALLSTGALLGVAALVKLTTVVLGTVLVLAYVMFEVHTWPARVRTVGWLLAGSLLVLIPAGLWLASVPEFAEWAIAAQSRRPVDSVRWRLLGVAQSAMRFPLLPLSVVASCWLMMRPPARTTARTLAATGLIGVLVLVFAFRSYATYYVVGVLPLLTACLAIGLNHWAPRLPSAMRSLWRPRPVALLSVVTCLVFVEAYDRLATDHVAAAARVVDKLKQQREPIYTMYPDLVLWSGQRLPDWYPQVDSFLGRMTADVHNAEFDRMLDGINTAVLYPDEFAYFPTARAKLHREFTRQYVDGEWEIWVRTQGVASNGRIPCCERTAASRR